ncbi:MAG: hypothetical protein ACM359_25190, partial [Bacillota bacterium]
NWTIKNRDHIIACRSKFRLLGMQDDLKGALAMKTDMARAFLRSPAVADAKPLWCVGRIDQTSFLG